MLVLVYGLVIMKILVGINQTKKDFNMNSKLKLIGVFLLNMQKIQKMEKIYFFDNWNLMEKNKRLEISDKLI